MPYDPLVQQVAAQKQRTSGNQDDDLMAALLAQLEKPVERVELTPEQKQRQGLTLAMMIGGKGRGLGQAGEIGYQGISNERDRAQKAADQQAERQLAASQFAYTDQQNRIKREDLTAYQRAQLDAGAEARAARQSEASDRAEDRAAREARTVEDRENKRLESLSKRLEASGAAELHQSVADADAIIKQYEGKDIPGVGGMSNVPLIGRFSGGEEGRQVRSRIAAVRNALLKARSGGAVTESEAARMEEELGTMLGASDETLRQTWPAFVTRFNATIGNLFAPYGDILPKYYEGGGNVRKVGGYGAAPGAGGGAAPGQATHRYNPATGKVEEVR